MVNVVVWNNHVQSLLDRDLILSIFEFVGMIHLATSEKLDTSSTAYLRSHYYKQSTCGGIVEWRNGGMVD